MHREGQARRQIYLHIHTYQCIHTFRRAFLSSSTTDLTLAAPAASSWSRTCSRQEPTLLNWNRQIGHVADDDWLHSSLFARRPLLLATLQQTNHAGAPGIVRHELQKYETENGCSDSRGHVGIACKCPVHSLAQAQTCGPVCHLESCRCSCRVGAFN